MDRTLSSLSMGQVRSLASNFWYSSAPLSVRVLVSDCFPLARLHHASIDRYDGLRPPARLDAFSNSLAASQIRLNSSLDSWSLASSTFRPKANDSSSAPTGKMPVCGIHQEGSH